MFQNFIIYIKNIILDKLKYYTATYISIKMDPKGRIPPNITMTRGSINHFFSGIGLGTAFTRQG